MRRALLAAVLAASSASCTVGAPPGFSSGDHWSVPLVGPLENGLLLVPALVNGQGPFVFAIDTDAPVSAVDQEVVQQSAPRTGEGPELLDETDHERDRFYAEILEWQLGTLSVKNKPAEIVPAHVFDAEGRRIHGIIGRDVLADSLTFGFDRDRGELLITTHDALKPLPTWQRVSFSPLRSQIQNVRTLPLSRKLVKAAINGTPMTLHLDFGAVASQLRSGRFAAAQLPPLPIEGGTVDEVGSVHVVRQHATATTVTLGALSARDVPVLPYADRRWRPTDLDGAIGLGFWSAYSVIVDWDANALYAWPRTRDVDVATRIARWHSRTLSGCANVGCVKLDIVDPVANVPVERRPAVHPGVVITAQRDPSAMPLDLEVLVAVQLAAPSADDYWFVINMPAGTDHALLHLPASYVGATLTVVDASPFPRTCPAAGACIDRVPAPR